MKKEYASSLFCVSLFLSYSLPSHPFSAPLLVPPSSFSSFWWPSYTESTLQWIETKRTSGSSRHMKEYRTEHLPESEDLCYPWMELLCSSANCRPLCEKMIFVWGASGAARARVTHSRTASAEAQESPDNSNSNRFMCSLSLSWGKMDKKKRDWVLHFSPLSKNCPWTNLMLFCSR